jgi:hypothetical protein
MGLFSIAWDALIRAPQHTSALTFHSQLTEYGPGASFIELIK